MSRASVSSMSVFSRCLSSSSTWGVGRTRGVKCNAKCNSKLQPLRGSMCRLYGSKTCISFDNGSASVGGAGYALRPHVGTCFLKVPEANAPIRSNVSSMSQVEFSVAFLGTGGGSPSMHRNTTCTALRLGGETFLFDACEGTPRQLTFTTVDPSKVTKIFITHLHGDHLYGLPSTLLEMQRAVKEKKLPTHSPPTVHVYGPPGLYNYVTMTLALSCSTFRDINVVVHELVGGTHERGPNAARQHPGRGNIFLSKYTEFDDLGIHHRYIHKGDDRNWTIDDPQQPTSATAGNQRRFTIKAAELDHLRGVQTFGYTVEEQLLPITTITIDPDKNRAEVVHPEQGMPARSKVPLRPRKFAILGDHRRIPMEMARLCTNADLLVHEATLMKADGHEKAIMRGHSTASKAGKFGKDMNCRVVALNHFGNTANLKSYVNNLLAEARETNHNTSQILASYDLMEVSIPRGGFNFKKENGS